MDICYIGAAGFHRNLTQHGAIPFVTSLYEIDQVISDREIEEIQADATREEQTNRDLIEQKLPQQYGDFKDVFSKEDSDILVPHRPYDLRIELEKNADLGFSLLR